MSVAFRTAPVAAATYWFIFRVVGSPRLLSAAAVTHASPPRRVLQDPRFQNSCHVRAFVPLRIGFRLLFFVHDRVLQISLSNDFALYICIRCKETHIAFLSSVGFVFYLLRSPKTEKIFIADKTTSVASADPRFSSSFFLRQEALVAPFISIVSALFLCLRPFTKHIFRPCECTPRSSACPLTCLFATDHASAFSALPLTICEQAP